MSDVIDGVLEFEILDGVRYFSVSERKAQQLRTFLNANGVCVQGEESFTESTITGAREVSLEVDGELTKEEADRLIASFKSQQG